MQAEALVVFFLNFSVCLFFFGIPDIFQFSFGASFVCFDNRGRKKKMKMSTTANAVKDRTVTTGRSYYYHYLI